MKTNVSNRPITLASSLRRVAELLRNGQVSYEWSKADQCNMGLVARASLGLSRNQFNKLEKPVNDIAGWDERAEAHCPITGIPELKLFRVLHDVGFRFEDYHEVEGLSNPDVCDRIKRDGRFVEQSERRNWWGRKMPAVVQRKIQYDEEQSLIVYLEAWAAMIEEFNSAMPSDAAMEQAESRPLVPVR